MKIALAAAVLGLLPSFAVGATAGAGESMIDAVKPYSVTLSVSNLAETAKWYEQKLGFKEVKSKDYPEFSTALIFLELNGFRVELIKDGNARSGITRLDPPKHTASWGISQFAFETRNLAALKSELAAKDVKIVWEFENADLGARFLFVRDPAGNLIQFLQKL
jgi:catechol 2,3-dioxygenase-like lactoylglutathione lyase family enzyme